MAVTPGRLLPAIVMTTVVTLGLLGLLFTTMGVVRLVAAGEAYLRDTFRSIPALMHSGPGA
jgi:hypothetical protein